MQLPETRPRTRLFAVTLILLSVSLGSALAQTPKIAVVDLDRVFAGSDHAARLQQELQKLEADTQKAIDDVAATLSRLQQEAATKSGDERLVLLRQREDEELKARRLADNAKRDANRKEQEIRAEFNEVLQGVFAELQQANSYDLILNKNPAIVIYAGDAIDISQAVLEKLESGS